MSTSNDAPSHVLGSYVFKSGFLPRVRKKAKRRFLTDTKSDFRVVSVCGFVLLTRGWGRLQTRPPVALLFSTWKSKWHSDWTFSVHILATKQAFPTSLQLQPHFAKKGHKGSPSHVRSAKCPGATWRLLMYELSPLRKRERKESVRSARQIKKEAPLRLGATFFGS